MKKTFYFLFTIVSMISCSNNDEGSLDNQNEPELEPQKAIVHYMQFPNYYSYGPIYYTFNYENGRLLKMTGKVLQNEMFFPEIVRTLSYSNNQVILNDPDDLYTKKNYTIENNRLAKAELYRYDELATSTSYTYENSKIIVYGDSYNKNMETITSYFFDANKNLIKSEKLDKSAGINKKLTTTNYSNFDNAKNPFKKLYLINDNFYEKSLSVNNYRKIEGTIYYYDNPNNYPPGVFMSQWNYKYDSNGQILLDHPF